jgi:transposase
MKNREFLLSKAPPKRRVLQNISLLFIRKIMLPGHAQVCSSTCNCFRIPTRSRASDGLGLRVYLGCTWRALDRSLLGSSADALNRVMLGSIAGALDHSSCAIDRTNRDQITL